MTVPSRTKTATFIHYFPRDPGLLGESLLERFEKRFPLAETRLALGPQELERAVAAANDILIMALPWSFASYAPCASRLDLHHHGRDSGRELVALLTGATRGAEPDASYGPKPWDYTRSRERWDFTASLLNFATPPARRFGDRSAISTCVVEEQWGSDSPEHVLERSVQLECQFAHVYDSHLLDLLRRAEASGDGFWAAADACWERHAPMSMQAGSPVGSYIERRENAVSYRAEWTPNSPPSGRLARFLQRTAGFDTKIRYLVTNIRSEKGWYYWDRVRGGEYQSRLGIDVHATERALILVDSEGGLGDVHPAIGGEGYAGWSTPVTLHDGKPPEPNIRSPAGRRCINIDLMLSAHLGWKAPAAIVYEAHERPFLDALQALGLTPEKR